MKAYATMMPWFAAVLSSCAPLAASFVPITNGPARSCTPALPRLAPSTTATPNNSPGALFGMFSSDDESAQGVQPPTLTSEQDAALRLFAETAVDVHGFSWFRRSECLDDCRAQHPTLADFTDDELAAAHLVQKPNLLDVFVKTPLGAFIGINVVLWAADFSWCDTPFGNPDACLPPPGM